MASAHRMLPALVSVLLLGGCDGGGRESVPPPTTLAEPPTTRPTVSRPPRAQPCPRPFSWRSAGALVWHEHDVDPRALGEALCAAGFGWVAVLLHDGLSEDAVEPTWIERFRAAARLPVGGWGVLRTEPEREAALADALLERHGLEFYVANAEAEYLYSGANGPDPERFARSRRFVHAFRAARPDEPGGLASYCQAERHDLDWRAWREARFVYLPEAYVNDFGAAASPAACLRAARGFFPRADVHPLIGTHAGVRGLLPANEYARMLAEARVRGFAVYPAETVAPDDWRAFTVR